MQLLGTKIQHLIDDLGLRNIQTCFNYRAHLIRLEREQVTGPILSYLLGTTADEMEELSKHTHILVILPTSDLLRLVFCLVLF